MIVVNSSEVPGKQITKTRGLVKGHTIRSIWIGKDLAAVLRLVVGGELIEYTEMMGKARDEAMQRMIKSQVVLAPCQSFKHSPHRSSLGYSSNKGPLCVMGNNKAGYFSHANIQPCIEFQS